MNSRELTLNKLTILAVISSFCGLVYSQLLVKTVVSISSQFLLAQTVTLACYLGAMGIGAWLSDRVRSPRFWLPYLQLAFALAGIFLVVSVYALYFINKFYFFEVSDPRIHEEILNFNLLMVAGSQPVALWSGFVSGMDLGLLLQLARPFTRGSGTSRVLAGSYLGNGIALFVFIWVMPKTTPLGLSLALAALNLTLGSTLCWWLFDETPRMLLRCTLLTGALSCLFVELATSYPKIQQSYLRARELQGVQVFSWKDLVTLYVRVLPERPSVLRHNTGYQNADFSFSIDGGYRFLLDNHIQTEDSWNASYHESLIHVPIQFFRKIPRNVLLMGGGDGIAVKELLKYDDKISTISLVDLDPWMTTLAKIHPFFLDINEGSLLNSKVNVQNIDAIRFMRNTELKYDTIYIDFPYPFEFELTKLFTAEFFQMAAKHLQADGQLVLDAPLNCGSINPLDTGGQRWSPGILLSLRRAGFKTIIPYCVDDEGFVVARFDHSIAQIDFYDYGIPLKELDARFLASKVRMIQVREDLHSGYNSLFRPLRPLRNREL